MTENNRIEGSGLEALGEVLERYGSDRTRWPAPVRRDFAGLLAGNDKARQRLREAEALDRLLDLAPPPAVDTRALAERIVAAATAETPVAAPAKSRVPWTIFERRPATEIRRPATETQWPAAALLAASLVLGTVFGLTGTFQLPVDAQMAASADEADIDPGQIAFDSDAIGLFEEDFL